MKKLCEIIDCEYDILVSGIETDSRKIKPGYLFVAVKGYFTNHEKYIDDAIIRGCVAVVSEEEFKLSVPCIKVSNINDELFDILRNYYDDIQKEFTFLGITGTDGKTTTATIISQILDCAYIGTNGVSYKNYHENTDNTTPDICELFKYLKKLNELGCGKIVMEVSSEALLHKRVDKINFDIAGITNITEDHLNIHKTIKNYIESKIKLFSFVNDNGFSILNIDDSKYDIVEKSCKNKYTYGKNKDADFKICNIKTGIMGSSFNICHKNKFYHIETKLPFIYNIYNITLAFIFSYLSNVKTETIIEKISKIENISGRSELLNFTDRYKIILDYAHTYNGIVNIVNNVKKINHNKIIVVTGAAGGREKEKRKHIGSFLLNNVDLVIFTMDDPRYEDVNSIIDDMLESTKKNNYLRIVNRKDAIKKALTIAKENDIVLVLGKGRDNYMAIENKKIPYSDYLEIKKYFTLTRY